MEEDAVDENTGRQGYKIRARCHNCCTDSLGKSKLVPKELPCEDKQGAKDNYAENARGIHVVLAMDEIAKMRENSKDSTKNRKRSHISVDSSVRRQRLASRDCHRTLFMRIEKKLG
jgi:hypothetical protein